MKRFLLLALIVTLGLFFEGHIDYEKVEYEINQYANYILCINAGGWHCSG